MVNGDFVDGHFVKWTLSFIYCIFFPHFEIWHNYMPSYDKINYLILLNSLIHEQQKPSKSNSNYVDDKRVMYFLNNVVNC